jgi:hypothetical protein
MEALQATRPSADVAAGQYWTQRVSGASGRPPEPRQCLCKRRRTDTSTSRSLVERRFNPARGTVVVPLVAGMRLAGVAGFARP